MLLSFKSSFKKDFRKLPKNAQERLRERLKLFQRNQFVPELNNHALKGKYEGVRSINVSGDLRALFIVRGEVAEFVRIDNHGNLYG